MRLAAALAVSLAVPRFAAAAPLPVHPAEATAVGEAPPLRISGSAAAAIVAGALTLWGASALEQSADDVRGCRWCEPGNLDLWARDALRWRDPRAAGHASDLLLLGVPIGSAATVAWLSAREGTPAEVLEDLSLIAAAMILADPLTTGVKHGTARLRPDAWAAGGPRVEGDLHSFFSGHASRTFAAAAAATQVARLRRRSGWKWLAAAGFTAASATAWLRVAADQHWATDVVAGAAVGAGIGWSVPSAALRPATSRPRSLTVVPAPGGLAIVF